MLPDKIADFGWFGAGWAVYKGNVEDPDFFPPLNDMEAQRDWLGGFGSAWTEYPDAAALRGDGTGGEQLDEALIRALKGRAALLRQLRAHCEARVSRTVH